MKNIYYILIALFVMPFNVLEGQNMIDNHSFEKIDPIVSVLRPFTQQPNQMNDFRWVNDWKSNGLTSVVQWINSCHLGLTQHYVLIETGHELRDPHWFVDNQFFLEEKTIGSQFSKINAASGNSYAGIQRGHLIQQKLNTRIKYSKSYRLTFKVRIPQLEFRAVLTPELITGDRACRAFSNFKGSKFHDDIKLNVFLADSDLKYTFNAHNLLSTCIPETIFELFTQVQGARNHYKAATINLGSDVFQAGKWHEIEIFIKPDALMPDLGYAASHIDEVFDWIAFDLDFGDEIIINPATGGRECKNPLVLIDDVVLEETDCTNCNNCSNKDGCMNPLIINNPNDPFDNCLQIQNLHNVSFMELEIYLINGAVVFNMSMENPPKLFLWDHILSNGTPVPPGFYGVRLKTINDCQVKYTYKAVAFGPNQGCFKSPSLLPFNVKKRICCGDDLIIKNEVLDKDEHYKAFNAFIGPNVIIKSGVSIKFQSQNLISMASDVLIEKGASVEAFIEPCSQEDIAEDPPLKIPSTSFALADTSIEKSVKRLVIEDENKDFTIFPNPNQGSFFIEINKNINGPLYLEILNITGQVIYQQFTNSENLNKIILPEIAKGVYLIRIKENNQWLETQRVIIN